MNLMPNAAAGNLFTLDVEHHGSVHLVHCHGRLVAGVCDVLLNRVRELIPGSTRVVLDLTDVTFVDSMGLGTLVRLYVSARNAGSCLELVNLGKQIRELLSITHLFSVFGDMCEQGITPRF
jgi:anti-sigma B factor antagonist